MFSVKKQRGLSAAGWLFVISVFGFSLLAVSKLGPHYLDHHYVKTVLKMLADNPKLDRMSAGEIREYLSKTFRLNNVRGKPTQSVKITKNTKGTLITIKYEERIPFIANIDVILSFHSELDSNKPSKCCRPRLK